MKLFYLRKKNPKRHHWFLFFILPLLLFIFSFSPFSVSAEELIKTLEERIIHHPNLNDLFEFAHQKNPMIKAFREEWRESVERYRLTTGYPDPQILMTYWPKSVANNLDADKIETMLSQSIPFPGKLSAAGRITQAQTRLKRFSLDRTIRDILISIRESYHELLYIREAGRISEQNEILLSQIRAMGESLYAQNKSQLIDVLKAQSQIAQTGYDRLLLGELEKTEVTRLNAILNRDPMASIGELQDEPVRQIAYTLDEIFFLAEKNRDEIKMAQAEIEIAQAEADMAKFETYPEFMLGVTYESDAPAEPEASREDMWGFQFGMSLPMWWEKNSGRIESAKSNVEKFKAMSIGQLNETRALVRENYFRLMNAQRLVLLYRDSLIPQSIESIAIADTWNRQNQSSFTDYIEAQSIGYNFQLALSRAKADYGKYLARLEGLAGQSLTTKTHQQESSLP
jgi:outer membrane protein TolC